jgi:hypothetical protein
MYSCTCAQKEVRHKKRSGTRRGREQEEVRYKKRSGTRRGQVQEEVRYKKRSGTTPLEEVHSSPLEEVHGAPAYRAAVTTSAGPLGWLGLTVGLG